MHAADTVSPQQVVVTVILVFIITIFGAGGRCSLLPFRSLGGTVTRSCLSCGDLMRTADEDKHLQTWAKVVLTAHVLCMSQNVSCYGEGREIKL